MNAQRLRHLKNATWSIAEGTGYPVLLLLATPILLSSLGAQLFGLWTLLITVTATGMVVGIGLSPAVVKLVAQSGMSSSQGIAATTSGALALATLGGGTLAVLVVVVMYLGAETWLSKLGTPDIIIATGVFSALILWIEQFDLVISSVIKGLENFGLAARLEIGLKVTQISLVMVTALAYKSLLPVFAAFLLMAVVRLVVKAFWLKKQCPEIKFIPRFSLLHPVLKLSKWGWLQGLGSICFLSADRFIIGAALGAASLGYYSIAVQLVSQMHSLIANAFSIIVPRVSKMNAQADGKHTIKSIAGKLIGINVLMALTGAALLFYIGPHFLALWVGKDVATHVAEAFRILVLAYALLSLSIVPFHVLTGLGSMRFIAIVLILGGFGTVLATYLLVPHFGIEGAAWGRAAYALIALALFVPLVSAHRWSAQPSLTPEPKKFELL